MSTPDQPGGLTRKQLRELRSTASVPVVAADEEAPDAGVPSEAPASAPAAPDDHAEPLESEGADVADAGEAAMPGVDEAAAQEVDPADRPEEQEAVEPPAEESEPVAPPLPPPVPSVHLPKAADTVIAPPPPADAQVDLGVAPLTRRQAREQERIRTASVPVITPDLLAAHAAASAPPVVSEPASEPDAVVQDADEAAESEPEASDASGASDLAALFEDSADEGDADEVVAEVIDDEPDGDAEHAAEADSASVDDAVTDSEPESDAEVVVSPAEDATAGDEPEVVEERPVLQPAFGAAVLATSEPVSLVPSFDELIARNTSSTGSVATPNALILSQTPSSSPLVAPVTATGEVLITGSLALPEGLGSRGHAPGVTDGKDIDSVLIDGELPATSSPTPIAASAAISTVKGTGEIIRPPAPEKGNKLMITLAITAGVLAIALVGVLILAFVTGVI